jgi:hypothetical protein
MAILDMIAFVASAAVSTAAPSKAALLLLSCIGGKLLTMKVLGKINLAPFLECHTSLDTAVTMILSTLVLDFEET